MDLFQASTGFQESGPLAERMRPQNLTELALSESVLRVIRSLIKHAREHQFLPNLILWGPPGTGKTTLARLLSREIQARFVACHAVETGAKALRELGQEAHDRRLQLNEKTLIFVDEIHRLNKSQQDVLLPFTESGDFILIGATTENPSYELTSALLSRSRVIVFEPLSEKDLGEILTRTFRKLGYESSNLLTPQAQTAFLQSVYGDARNLLNGMELIIFDYRDDSSRYPLNREELSLVLNQPSLRYDKTGDEHYNIISAFIKSVRGSDPDAAIYYLARMLTGGEDPVFIARRLVILASEDIGNADPRALSLAVAGLQAVELIGMPEARINLAQVTTYLASAPKSNRSYLAITSALEYVKATGALPVPKALRSAQTQLAKDLGYGEDYKYSHDSKRGYILQDFLPEAARQQIFYEPSQHGFEKNIQQYLSWLRGESPSKEDN